MHIISVLIMMEGLIIVLAKWLKKESASVGEAKGLMFVYGFFICGIFMIIMPSIIHLTGMFSIISHILNALLFVIAIVISAGITIGIICIADHLDFIYEFIKKIIWFFTGWYFNLNKWVMKKALEEDKNGHTNRRRR